MMVNLNKFLIEYGEKFNLSANRQLIEQVIILACLNNAEFTKDHIASCPEKFLDIFDNDIFSFINKMKMLKINNYHIKYQDNLTSLLHKFLIDELKYYDKNIKVKFSTNITNLVKQVSTVSSKGHCLTYSYNSSNYFHRDSDKEIAEIDLTKESVYNPILENYLNYR